MIKYKYIQIVVSDSVVNIVFNRIKQRNALNPEMITEIQSTLESYKDNPNIRVILFSSASNIFCAGADLKYLNNIQQYTYEQHLNDSRTLMNLFKTMLSYPKLIISKVIGPAIAGGCGIATASDFIFCTSDSSFGYPEVKIGFMPALVSTFLKYKIKHSDVTRLLLTGDIIQAEEAQKIGLVNYIDKIEDIDHHISKFIHTHITHTSSISIAYTKKLQFELNNLDTRLNIAAEFNANIRLDADFKKGIQSFLNKISINWTK
jgi:methylglutaconyl-CoA hydratase